MKPVVRSTPLLILLVLFGCANPKRVAPSTPSATPAVAAPATPAAAPYERQRLSLDRGWLFHEGDIPFPVISGHQQSYNNAKAGTAWGAAAPGFDDSSWKPVNLPHDWAVEQPFDQKANISQGYRARGMGWYRKYFRLDPADHGKHLELQLDGVATHCTIWVNGVLAERNWCGYTSIYVDITPYVKFGNDMNVIAVQVDAVAQEGWWYEGAGLYRHAWLVKRSPVRIETDGVYANPVRNPDGQWAIPIEVTLNSSDKAPASVEVESTLMDPSGKVVVSAGARADIDPLKDSVAKFMLPVAAPELWSLEKPALYSVRTVVKQNGAEVDGVTTQCGFRTIRFDPDKGFFLNDRHVELLGTCNHQDMAGVGVAVPDSIWDFRVRRLKEMGANANRCAHNPPAAEFLDACDRLGMLVMDENRDFGSAPENLRQLDWMVRRDRNHPSVILWSVFNEEPSQGTEMGYEMVRRMSAAVKKHDTTRPVTAAQSNSDLNPTNASLAADVAGFNYVYYDFDRYHALHPTKPLFSSEDTSTVMTREEYASNRRGTNPVLDSYDDTALAWGLTHRNAWKEVATRPFVAGTMVWTGFDYRGEPQPLSWPAAGSSFGCMDLCGFPKAAYYIHQAQWIQDRPVLHLIPHWNWAGSEGKPIKVMAFSNAGKVALILNGKPLEEKAVDKYQMVAFQVPYESGKLEAVATTDGKEVTASKIADDPSVMRAERQGDFWNFGGIYRPVYLEALPAQYIDWTGIDANAKGEFKADLHFGPGVKLGPTVVTAQVWDAQNQPVGAPFSSRLTDGPRDAILDSLPLVSHFDGVKLWTAETPNLYQVRFTLLQNGEPEHVITNRFGFRTIELRTNDGFYLNGVKIVMKGVNRHSMWADSGRTLSKELCNEDARLIKDMNMNAVRMSHYPPDRDFLDACDEQGIYVLDELTGWGGHYETPTGKKLVGEMVRRDVNHPSILVWDNGNEGGWNNALNDEYAKWDIQQRNVMHPRSTDRGVNDPHYPDYAAIVRQSGGPAVYFPTEFLHGLYDGGLGSGFHDFWEVLRKSPVLGGAFFWVMIDDGVVRTDKGGIVDNEGDQGPDGIMGPRREKEGSYYTIKEIWSPVEIEAPAEGLLPGFQGAIKVRNSYDFTDLSQCSFSWEYVSFPGPNDGQAGHKVLAGGEIPAPSVAPHGSGELKLKLPDMPGVHAVYFTAKNPAGQNLWTWSWPVATVANTPVTTTADKVTTKDDGGQLTVNAGALELQFSKTSGVLTRVSNGGKIIPLANGPSFIAYTHGTAAGRTITYQNLAGTNATATLTTRADGGDLLVEANYDGAFKQVSWRISPDGRVKLNYTYSFAGKVDLLGVNFDFPETDMKGITWLGNGPYHVWQNRLQGARLDVWHNNFNNTVPSVVYSFDPEFKGYFRDWRWATFDTAEGKFTVSTPAAGSHLGIYHPNDGPEGPLLALPDTGLTFLDVIPAMRTKFLTQERMGPQSAQRQVSGEHIGEVTFDFGVK